MSRSAVLDQRGPRIQTLTAIEQEDLINELRYRLCERAGGLREFAHCTWPILEPAIPLAWEWSHDAVCDHLEAVTCGHIQKLLINIPPRHMKSTLVTIMWPCWDWGPADKAMATNRVQHPRASKRWIFSSYAQSLSLRDSLRRRLIFQDPWFQSGWGDRCKIGGQRFLVDAQVKYANAQQGYHLSTSVEGSNTGEGGDILVADDPHNMNEIHSETQRNNVIRWWSEVMATRLNDQRTGAKVIIMQRGHELDLSGHSIEQGYVHLNLQAEFRPDRRCRTFLDSQKVFDDAHREWTIPDGTPPFFEDPRTEPDELLSPTRFPRYVIEQLKLDLGDAYNAQFQQDPTPEEGGILKAAWWRYWAPAGHPLVGTTVHHSQKTKEGGIKQWTSQVVPLPNRFQERLDSWDMAFGDDEEAQNSFVAGLACGRNKAQAYLLKMERQHHDFIESVAAVKRLRADAHKQKPDEIRIERKANGQAIIRTLRDDVPGIIGVDVAESKESRAWAAAPRVKAGNYYLPHPDLEKDDSTEGIVIVYQDGRRVNWVHAFIHETKMFPNGAYNDQVDAFTQADQRLFGDLEIGTERTTPNVQT